MSLYGQVGVFSRTDTQSGKQCGVIFFLRRSSTAQLIEIALTDKIDFASGVVLFLQNKVALQILLVYLPPKKSSHFVSCDVLRQCIIDFLDESKKMIPGQHERSLCVMGDLNLPNATWALLCSPHDFENHILTTLSSYDLFPLNFSATHKAGSILDNVLCQHQCFSYISVDISCNLSDHYPLMFTLYDNTETTPISNLLTSRYSFNSHDDLVKFEEGWASYAKAFDKVFFNIFPDKVKKFGFDYISISLLVSYLKNRCECVSIIDILSIFLPLISGVPQGSVIGPLLFTIFNIDLPSVFLDSMSWFFADNLKLIFSWLVFENNLARLSAWNIANGTLINAKRSRCLIFEGEVNVFIGHDSVENISSHKNLGITFSTNL